MAADTERNIMAKRGVAYFNENGTPICGAQRQNKPGVRCQAPPLKGSTRCKLHGGAAARGPALPHYKDGKHSRYFGEHRLQPKVMAALADPDFLSLRPELALVDAMLSERWEALEEGGNDDLWPILEKQVMSFKGAMAAGDVRKMRSTISDIEHTVSKGNSEVQARKEIRELIKDRQRLAESMQNTLIKLDQTVTVQQTIGLLQQVIEVVSETVTDRKEISTVMRKIAGLADRADLGPARMDEVVEVAQQ